MAAAPFAAQAETWNIYGWQNHSWEFIDVEGGRSYDRTQSNAGNIGFAGSVDTGMNGIHVNVQCEQFTFYNHFGGFGDWCNRNSKIGLSHPQMGEIMIATWLLPYNEGVAQWVDPFYDAGADSHTSIMGSVGGKTLFYNAGFSFSGGQHLGFNRRQENIIQYWSPNWNGFVFRFAWTVGNQDETPAKRGGGDIDPIIRSSSLAYTNGPFWAAVTWQDHEDWSAVNIGEMQSSDAESIRIAGRYIMDLGDGMSVQISAMYEDLEYEFNNISSLDAVMDAFGLGNFTDSYALSGTREGSDAVMSTFAGLDMEAKDMAIKRQKTLAGLHAAFDYDTDAGTDGVQPRTITVTSAQATAFNTANNLTGDDVLTAADYTLPAIIAAVMDNPRTVPDEAVTGNGGTSIADYDSEYDTATAVDADGYSAIKAAAAQMRNYLRAAQAAGDPAAAATEGYKYKTAYDMLVTTATTAAEMAFTPTTVTKAVPAITRADVTENRSAKIEREAWMVSGKIKFGGPVDFRFSYMDADDLEVSCGSACSGDWNDTAADAWNVGMFYTMPAGTELRLTYSEVDNDTNGSYDFGIGGAGVKTGGSVEMFAVGIVHWFD
ncbi:MAG: porin [Gammaproteobacteria bacterium]|nr:porin [Gammaproteobacteria bacterium]